MDGWSINKGSCGFKYQRPDVYPGVDVAALSDAHPSEYLNSCGRCYEVKCAPLEVTDGYGQTIDRQSACYNSSQSVVVKIVDSCDCIYPSNSYSNRRWCCGDAGAGAGHFDLSVWAFEKLANKTNGVIAISFRRVSCSYRPPRPAPSPVDASPLEDSTDPQPQPRQQQQPPPPPPMATEAPSPSLFDLPFITTIG